MSYWYAQTLSDADVYSVRERTKKEAIAVLESLGFDDWKEEYAPPKKVTVEYSDGFDLLQKCSDESHHYWEAS